jgi:DNA helicase-2/ATP-dependent DNA helicase PcrA
LRVPLLPNHQIIYGSALHKAVQNYFNAKQKGEKFNEKQLLDSFANNWSSEGFITRAHEEQRFNRGKTALKRFYQQAGSSKRDVKFVEEEFSVLKDKIQVKGRIDLVEELKGKTYIVDFKSSEVEEQEKADARVKDSLQLSIYALAWKEKYKVIPDQIELYFLDTGLVGTAKRLQKELDSAWEKIKRVAVGIRAGDYHATPNSRACSYCPYNEECPSSAV